MVLREDGHTAGLSKPSRTVLTDVLDGRQAASGRSHDRAVDVADAQQPFSVERRGDRRARASIFVRRPTRSPQSTPRVYLRLTLESPRC